MNIEDITGDKNNSKKEIVSCPLTYKECEHKFEEYCVHNQNFEICEWYPNANKEKRESSPDKEDGVIY
ncbi:MAG TPA: hypothetical protein VJH65_02980 [Candidatus Nanoarchaeia archaeon]|nr:hypothetical protein [Candidatus Nanoarchaeia archaeon]